MRALLARDYEQMQWTVISRLEVAFMAAYPGESYLILFDYRRGRVEVKIEPVARSSLPDTLTSSSEWLNDVARASKSNGRLELHVMAIAEGSETRYVVIPLRTNDVRRHNTLARLASFSPPSRDIPQLVEGVRLSVHVDTIEIY